MPLPLPVTGLRIFDDVMVPVKLDTAGVVEAVKIYVSSPAGKSLVDALSFTVLNSNESGKAIGSFLGVPFSSKPLITLRRYGIPSVYTSSATVSAEAVSANAGSIVQSIAITKTILNVFLNIQKSLLI